MSENVVTILKNANVTDIQHCWNPGSVVIPGVGDYKDFFSSESNNTNGSRSSNTQPRPHTDIKTDLMSIFCDDENEYSKKAASSTNHPSLYLSPLLYPPNKEKWKDISETIISAFLEQGNTQLIRQYTGQKKIKQVVNSDFI